MMGNHPAARLDRQHAQQPVQSAGILGGNDVGLREQPAQPGRGVLRITDRRRGKGQPATHGAKPVITAGIPCPAAYDARVTVTREASAAAPTGDEGQVARLRQHLIGVPLTDTMRGWLAPLAVTALAALLRLWHLGQPHKLIFDETYYVKQAYTLWRDGYENQWPEGSDAKFTVGNPDVYLTAGDRAVHPPVGKWMIAAGERLFGIDNAFGWRFSAAVVGILSVLILARTARRMFGSTALGTLAGLLLAIDGNHLVMSRTGILDIFVSFWALCCFSALVVDRDWSRARLARLTAAGDPGVRAMVGWVLWRPWRAVAVVSIALCTGTKWSGLYFLAAFAVMTILWDAAALRALGRRRWLEFGLLVDGVLTAVLWLPSVALIYLSTWTGWFRSDNGYFRNWAAEHPASSLAQSFHVPDAIRSLWHYHADMYTFNTTLKVHHDYMSNPWSWMVQGRPTSFFYESPTNGVDGCTVAQCSKAITSLGNPLIWWVGTAGLFIALVYWAFARDWRAGAALAGLVGGYLPWFLYQDRTIYTFYTVAFVPYVVLLVTFALAVLIGPRSVPVAARRGRVIAAGLLVVAMVAVSAFYWPIWVADTVPYDAWRARMWFPSWI